MAHQGMAFAANDVGGGNGRMPIGGEHKLRGSTDAIL
jgi:hypothetical protein